jgi:hypothetical protein
MAEHQRGDRASPEVLRGGVRALEDEEARDAAVVLLRQRSDLARPDDADELCPLERLQVVADGPLRHRQRLRELRRARGALAEERDDLRPHGVREGAQLVGFLDGEDVVELVVG